MGLFDGLFGSSGSNDQTITTETNIPKWIQEASQSNIAEADRITSKPYQQYGGQRVAGFSPTQTGAFDLTKQTVGGQQPYLDKAAEGALSGYGSQATIEGVPALPSPAATPNGSIQGPERPGPMVAGEGKAG